LEQTQTCGRVKPVNESQKLLASLSTLIKLVKNSSIHPVIFSKVQKTCSNILVDKFVPVIMYMLEVIKREEEKRFFFIHNNYLLIIKYNLLRLSLLVRIKLTINLHNLEENYIYSNNKFFHNFYLSESCFTCPGIRASGLA
jgi:hypothetical protein